jgi:nucleoside-diphosphate-sugar epimerase
MRVAVTGATGFIGRHLTARLVARGCDVQAIVRPSSSGRVVTGASTVRVPLAVADLERAFAGAATVVHLAGLVRAGTAAEYDAANVDATRAVAGATRHAGARLIHISSLAAAGPAPLSAPRSEDDPAIPLTPYGRSKLAGEQVVQETPGLRWTILRPGIVYGPDDRAMLPLFRLAAHGVLPIVGNRHGAYTLIHIADLAGAIEAAIDASSDAGVVFAGHRTPATTEGIFAGIEAAVGRSAWHPRVPAAAARLAAGVADLVGRVTGRPLAFNGPRYLEMSAPGFVCTVDRLRDRLGFVAATDLREGFVETAAWYRDHRWL